MSIRSDPRSQATRARRHAIGCAQRIDAESDEAVKTYLRQLALSWHQVAEQHAFLAELEEARELQRLNGRTPA